MNTTTEPVLDAAGRRMFECRECGRALTVDDFFVLGMRLPERGETRDDYCDAELIDSVRHAVCPGAPTAVDSWRLTVPPRRASVRWKPKGE
jgi:hypothetical protein